MIKTYRSQYWLLF